jgi:chemotaxis protein methyltransferase CheR
MAVNWSRPYTEAEDVANAALEPRAFAKRRFPFRDVDFARVRRMIHQRAGIALGPHKQEMAYGRLARRLRILGRKDFRGYLDMLESQPASNEWEHFINALTTNLTAFFREPHHFAILAAFVRQRSSPISVWCSGSSSGEEAYSIAMTLVEALRERADKAAVFATDIDTHAIRQARTMTYPYERVAKLEQARLKCFFCEAVAVTSVK